MSLAVSLPARPRAYWAMDAVAGARLGELVGRGAVCVLSGAGLSTESGIPDYRGPSGALRARLPMTFAEFRGSSGARQRYWARAHVGWRRVAAARPNAGHRAVAALEQAGVVRGIITQNVDGLHQAAGARDVIELHGALDRVVCLECGARSTRGAFDERLRAANPDLDWDEVASSNPDGDAELADEQIVRFRLVGCECCGADLLKPDVVFFGESVPRPRVQRCFELLDRSACPARARVLADGDVRAAIRKPGSAGANSAGDCQSRRDSWRPARRRQGRRRTRRGAAGAGHRTSVSSAGPGARPALPEAGNRAASRHFCSGQRSASAGRAPVSSYYCDAYEAAPGPQLAHIERRSGAGGHLRRTLWLTERRRT